MEGGKLGKEKSVYGEGVALGIPVGLVLGIAMDNIGFGLILGVALGVLYGKTKERKNKKD